MEVAQIIDLLRFPLETAGIVLLLQIRHRQAIMVARVVHIESKLGIAYPLGVVS